MSDIYNLHEENPTEGVRVFDSYPRDFQLTDFPKDYADSTITNINAAFFFCKAEKGENDKPVIAEEEKHLITLAKNIIEATTDTYKPKVTFVIDEDIFKDTEAFAKKYANRRPEHETSAELATQLLGDEAKIIREKLSNPEYMASIFTKAAEQMGEDKANADKAKALAKDGAISFRLAKMPEKGLEYPSWNLKAPREEGKPELHGTQYTPPKTDKTARPWVIGHPEKLKERFTEQRDAFLDSLTEEQISKDAKEAKDLSKVDKEKLSEDQQKELTELRTMDPAHIADANQMREKSQPPQELQKGEKGKADEDKGKKKKIFAIVGAVVAAAIAVFVGKKMMGGGKEEPQQKAAGGRGQ